MDRAPSRVAAIVGAGLGVLLTACAEPNLHLRVQLPEGMDREGLTVTLSIFAPAADGAADCEAIAFGDVTLAELRAARIARQVLQAPGVTAGTVEGSASVPRDGVKLLLALAARAFAGLEPELAEAEAAGCRAIDRIDGDLDLDLPLQWTAAPAHEASSLYLVARLDSAGTGAVASQHLDGDGAVHTETGVRILLQRADGQPTDSDLRLALRAASQVEQHLVVASDAGVASAGFTVGRAGLFEVALRARYQRGPDLAPLRGLAYQVALDSDDSAELRAALAGCADVTPGPIGQPGSVAGFVCARQAAAGQAELVLIGVGLGSGAPRIAVQRRPIAAESVQVLGHLEDASGVSAYAVNVLPGPGVNARLQLLRSDGAQLLDQELPGPPRLIAVSAMAQAGACAGGTSVAGFIVGLRTLLDPAGNLVAWQLYRTDPPRLVLQQALAQAVAVARLRPSLCLDDQQGQPVRLFPMRGGFPLPPISMFALGDELVLGQLNTLRYLDGLIESARVASVEVPTDQGPRARALAWFKLNGAVELNLHALGVNSERCIGFVDAGSADAGVSCLADFSYLQTALHLAELPPVVVGEVLAGRLLDAQAGAWPDVAAGLIRGTAYGAFHTELYLLNLGGGPHGRVAVDACADARGCAMAVADLDGDGADELLLSQGTRVDGTAHVQVLRFRISP